MGEETDKPNREAEGASKLRRAAGHREHGDRSSSKGRSRRFFTRWCALHGLSVQLHSFIKYLGFCLWVRFLASGSPPVSVHKPRGILTHFPSLTPTIGWPRARLESSFNAHKYSPEVDGGSSFS